MQFSHVSMPVEVGREIRAASLTPTGGEKRQRGVEGPVAVAHEADANEGLFEAANDAAWRGQLAAGTFTVGIGVMVAAELSKTTGQNSSVQLGDLSAHQNAYKLAGPLR